MDYKTRTYSKVGYVENFSAGTGYIRNGPLAVYRTDVGLNPFDPATPTEKLPNGGLLLDVWPTGELRVTDRISLGHTPYPHTAYTYCHQDITRISNDCWSRGEYRFTSMATVPISPPRSYTYVPDENNFDVYFYQSALWNYSPGRIYSPEDSEVRRAAESALLNLWAGRPRRHMNVALALIELKDVKQTLTQFIDFAKWGNRLLKGQVHLPKHIVSVLGPPGAINLSCRKMAEAYLWYTFGVRPTVDDVVRFIKECSKGRINVRGRKRKPLLIGRTYANGFDVKLCDFTPPSPPDIPSWTLDQEVRGTPYHGPQYKYRINNPPTSDKGYSTVEYYGKVFAKVRAQGQWTWKYFPSSMSWSCPLLRTAWELVPFSFVLDWFVDVGKSIQRLDDLSWVATTRFAFDEPWIWIKKIQTHYAPVTRSRAGVSISDITPHPSNVSPYITYHVNAYSHGLCEYRLERRIITFDRMPCSEYGLSYASLWRGLIPEWQGKLKAYQISSGMALLESVFHLI